MRWVAERAGRARRDLAEGSAKTGASALYDIEQRAGDEVRQDESVDPPEGA
jgi:hypothetical protein